MAILSDTFLLTIITIVISTLIIAFIKRIHIDRCLKGFENDYAIIYMKNGDTYEGKLGTANTGLEVLFDVETPSDSSKMSYIIYKEEYVNVLYIARDHKKMNARNKKQRVRELKKAYHPKLFRRILRRISNFFKILKDALMEIFTQLSGKIKTGAANYAGQEKYALKVNKELVNIMDTSYNPILEKYIGNLVAADIKNAADTQSLVGILKDYSSQYIELWDVRLKIEDDEMLCDMLLPTSSSRVRNIAEVLDKFTLSSIDFHVKAYDKYFKNLNRPNKGKKNN